MTGFGVKLGVPVDLRLDQILHEHCRARAMPEARPCRNGSRPAKARATTDLLVLVVGCVPIRLGQTPTTCRMRPLTGIEPRVGRRLNAARDAEERAEGVERVVPSVEAERELVEIGL